MRPTLLSHMDKHARIMEKSAYMYLRYLEKQRNSRVHSSQSGWLTIIPVILGSAHSV